VVKLAWCSRGFRDGEPYQCAHPWPEHCFVQCGDRGIVLRAKGSYQTAFFEACPPETFIRGEGKTIPEAEADAWKQYQRILACPGHEFERRGYDNGAGFCKHCNMFKGNAFEPLHNCAVCGVATYHTHDTNGNWYCLEHMGQIPEEKQTESFKMCRRVEAEWAKWDKKGGMEAALGEAFGLPEK
jgi:hypothetical protein